MEDTTVTLTEQQVGLLIDLLNAHENDYSTTTTDRFIVHEIIKKLTPDDI